MPTEGFENCGNATLVAARSVPNLVPAGAVSASVLTLNLTTATLLELQFNEFGKCAPPPPHPPAASTYLELHFNAYGKCAAPLPCPIFSAVSDERAHNSPWPTSDGRADQR